MNVFAATLEACDPARGHYRAYRLEAGTDLFGAWLVDVTYGRIGARGRTIRYLARDEAEAKKLVRQSLRRRGTARKRIGVGYELRELVDPGEWLECFDSEFREG
ncbi:WGR domain-containing protein [Tautonia rosea]|uniref:WGR domain-containing protein n=1 Tax=Tautonia rosea TaxID=2728037 RepID=UPI0014746AAF|nr:WGR domain-containing protein [Tautonia rosea]